MFYAFIPKSNLVLCAKVEKLIKKEYQLFFNICVSTTQEAKGIEEVKARLVIVLYFYL